MPGIGGPSSVAGGRDGQAALRLHAGIAVVAFVLCGFVSGVFFYLDAPIQGVIFAVFALVCLGVLAWAVRLRRRSAPDRDSGER